MNMQRTVTRVVVLAATVGLAACTGTSMQPPAGTSGAGLPGSGGMPGSSGSPAGPSGAGSSGAGQSGSGQSGPGQPGAGQAGSSTAGNGAGEDPAAVFDKSLGDFDGEIGRERDAMAKAGQGSGRAAETRQSGDTGAVKTAGRAGTGGPDVSVSGPGMGAGFPGGMGGIGAPGGIGGDAGGRPAGKSAGTGGKGAAKGPGQGGDDGAGPDGEPGTPDDTGSGTGPGDKTAGTTAAGSGTPAKEAGGAGGPGGAGNLPADIPADGTGEDQVARQLREAALAEKDPAIREALWDEYRKTMGIRKK